MKLQLTVLCCLILASTMAQETTTKEVSTEISEVTVFINGAQITRVKDVSLQAGKTTLNFNELSPSIDAKTIQVKASNGVTVLSVNHQQNHINKLQKTKELTDLEEKLKDISNKIRIEETNSQATMEELSFLSNNKVVTGSNQSLNVATLKEASEFYGAKVKELKLKGFEIRDNLSELYKQQTEIAKQISTITGKNTSTSGEIMVEVETNTAINATFTLTYIVANAGWFPSYDIRASSIDKPIEIVYKANVRQNTMVDWKNVKLKFSSTEPNISSVAPVMQTYRLDYNVMAPRYNKQTNSATVSGIVTDRRDGLPIICATVAVTGTAIRTTTDYDGYYSITLPANAQQLTFSEVDYISRTVNISAPVINIALRQKVSEEIVPLTADGITSKKMRKSSNLEFFAEENAVDIFDSDYDAEGTATRAKGATNTSVVEKNSEVPTQAGNQTSVTFDITKPYTIASDNKTTAVEMVLYSIPTKYQYFSIPKIDQSAFLIANINDWEKYNLLEGEANVFFEETFVGKTLLNINSTTDTLQISLGRDRGISINREKEKSFTNKQIIGTKKTESRNWKNTIKNNKSQEIDIIVLDQVPISTNQEIEVSVDKTTGAKHNTINGEIRWELKLAPNTKQELDLNYSVKYPKNRKLIVE